MRRTKQKFLLLLLLVSLCLTSCREKQDNDVTENDNAKQNVHTVDIRGLTKLDIVTDNTSFSADAEEQSWHFETDMNQNSLPLSGIADSGENTYINCLNSLIKFPKNAYTASIMCEKADCLHIIDSLENKNSITPADIACEADLSIGENFGMGLQYYDGYLYYIIKDGGIGLCRISSDGRFKSQIMLLADNASGNPEQNIPWLIHRGNVYFWNYKEGVCRVSLLNPKSRDVIMIRQEGSDELPILKAYGSFLYFVLPGAKEDVWLFCRYNAESEQIEQFTEINGRLTDFIVKDNKIYYQKYNEALIYQYDIDAGKNEVYFELESKENSFYADADYIYIPHADSMGGNDESFNVMADVYTWDKVYVGIIQMKKKIKDKSSGSSESIYIVGSDEDRIFYQREIDSGRQKRQIISYINKSEISENGAIMNIAYEYYI